MSLDQELLKKFNNKISNNISLTNYSWFNLGGPAEYLFKPENINQLKEFIRYNKKNKLKITILGAGSNTLIRDRGIKGVVIKLGSNFSKINLIDKNTIEVGAATLDRKISNFAADNGIGEFEFLSCIPGSIGGAVIMNSGCYGTDISKILVSINVIDTIKCEEKEINSKEIDFFYRGTSLPKELLITSVKLRGKLEKKESIKKNNLNSLKKKNYLNQVKSKLVGVRSKI